MTVRSTFSTATTPSYLVTRTGAGAAVYVNEVFKGYVRAMRAPGFFVARDISNRLITNPDDVDGLWTSEQDALDALARL